MKRCLLFAAILMLAIAVSADDAKEKLMDSSGGFPGLDTPCPAITAIINCGDSVAVDTTGSTDTMGAYSCVGWAETGPENVYDLTLPAGGPYDVVVTSANMAGGDLDFFIMTAPCDSDNCLAYGDTGAVAAAVAGGTNLFISVDGYNGAAGTVDLTVQCQVPLPPPANEDCGSATVITSLPFTDTVDTSLAAASSPAASCNSSTATEMQNDVWYAITPTVPCDIDVVIDDSVGAGYDMMAGIHSGSCGGLTEITCLDSPEPMTYTIAATAGTTYYIQTGDWGTSPGGGLTQVDVSTQTPGGCAPVPVELMQLEID